MKNPRLAGIYAKSLVDIATEKNALNDVYTDIKWFKGVCTQNRDFVNLLTSPIVPGSKKLSIIESIAGGKLNAITMLFVKLLVNKGREKNLPEIVESFLEKYNAINKIQRVTITTAQAVTDDIKNSILANLPNNGNTFEVDMKVNEALIGGYVLETNNQLIDASILYDLNAIKKQFLNNDFVHNIR
jgi:F-type H+-transporting ATPase subunit delta